MNVIKHLDKVKMEVIYRDINWKYYLTQRVIATWLFVQLNKGEDSKS